VSSEILITGRMIHTGIIVHHQRYQPSDFNKRSKSYLVHTTCFQTSTHSPIYIPRQSTIDIPIVLYMIHAYYQVFLRICISLRRKYVYIMEFEILITGRMIHTGIIVHHQRYQPSDFNKRSKSYLVHTTCFWITFIGYFKVKTWSQSSHGWMSNILLIPFLLLQRLILIYIKKNICHVRYNSI
jgi:hypothetical protein